MTAIWQEFKFLTGFVGLNLFINWKVFKLIKDISPSFELVIIIEYSSLTSKSSISSLWNLADEINLSELKSYISKNPSSLLIKIDLFIFAKQLLTYLVLGSEHFISLNIFGEILESGEE